LEDNAQVIQPFLIINILSTNEYLWKTLNLNLPFQRFLEYDPQAINKIDALLTYLNR
jgi:hypothetical protein